MSEGSVVRLEPWDEHNQALVANVHPPAWANPQPSGRYNLVVIGAGTAGLVTAAGSAGLGARVALIERDLMGGDCLNVGCVPSKALIRAARAVADARDAGALGIGVPGEPTVDFPAVMRRMRRLRAELSPIDSAARFKGLGVDVYLGQGTFTGPDAITVDGRTLRFKRAVIATGARAAVPPIPGLGEAGYLTNESVFSLTTLPRRIAVIGGGPIGCELAQAFARFGARVHVVQMGRQLLGREDPDAARLVRTAFERDGIRLALGVRVVKVERGAGGKVLHLASAGDAGAGAVAGGAGAAEPLEVDEILVAVGRAPNVEGLGLEAAGVAYDKVSGVKVDDRLRTTNLRVFAAGDICTPLKFTHHSDFHARLVIQNALFFGRAKESGLVVPRCTYTDPEVAHVGATAEEAQSRGQRVRTFVQELADVDRARLDGETEGFVKVHVAEGSDRIVGATIVARHAGEMLPELTMAITQGIGLGKIARIIHTYPTQAEGIRKLGDAYNRTRLTPTVKRLFETWLRWTR
jgi:pyruvate/2-oxoglutarate dehydrogenase complex dihydrolipoamide dehydrogenase (E3) component